MHYIITNRMLYTAQNFTIVQHPLLIMNKNVMPGQGEGERDRYRGRRRERGGEEGKKGCTGYLIVADIIYTSIDFQDHNSYYQYDLLSCFVSLLLYSTRMEELKK